MIKGCVVVAVGQITEDVEGEIVVHAEPGGRGEVIDALEGEPVDSRMVRWEGGTVCQCLVEEISAA